MAEQSGGVRCAECGAYLRAEAEWCAQCLARVEREPTFAPPDAFLGPPRPKAYSRRVKTSVSYGLTGRVIATFLLVIMPSGFLLTYAFPFGIIYVVAAVPLLLGSIWKKTPVPPDADASEHRPPG